MAGPGNILIRIGAEAAGALSEFDKVNGKMAQTQTTGQKIGSALSKAAVPATIALGAIAIGAKKAIDAAADLEKQVQKTAAVFGPSGDEVVKWSEHLARSFGLSSDEALTMANRFGNLFVNLGYSKTQAAGMSEQFVQLAADLASFNHVPVEQTMAALQSGMAGATRGLKKYGIVIDQTALKNEAMREGLYSGKGALDAHAKAAATMTLILQQTSNAQGDFAKHSKDSANAAAIQKAELANLTEQLGGALLPYYESFQQVLISATGVMASHQTAIKVLIGVVAGLSAAIIAANAAFKAYQVVMNVAKVATIAFSAANRAMMLSLAANPITLAIVALVALGVALYEAYQHSQTFRNIVHAALASVENAAHSLASAFSAVYHAALQAFDWIVAHWRLAFFALGPIGVALYELSNHFDQVRSAASSAFGAILSVIHAVTNAVEALVSALGRIKVPHISLPHIPGVNVAGYAFPAPAGFGPVAYAGGVPAAGGRAAIGGGGGVTVNFYGPTDPEGAARAIARVLRRHDQRQGRLP